MSTSNPCHVILASDIATFYNISPHRLDNGNTTAEDHNDNCADDDNTDPEQYTAQLMANIITNDTNTYLLLIYKIESKNNRSDESSNYQPESSKWLGAIVEIDNIPENYSLRNFCDFQIYSSSPSSDGSMTHRAACVAILSPSMRIQGNIEDSDTDGCILMKLDLLQRENNEDDCDDDILPKFVIQYADIDLDECAAVYKDNISIQSLVLNNEIIASLPHYSCSAEYRKLSLFGNELGLSLQTCGSRGMACVYQASRDKISSRHHSTAVLILDLEENEEEEYDEDDEQENENNEEQDNDDEENTDKMSVTSS
jgi:hypothetical protein